MNHHTTVTVAQLRQAIVIQEQIESLQTELNQILGGEVPVPSAGRGRHKMSAAGRARIAAAQRARWAKVNGGNAEKTVKPRRKMSAAGRAAISAAAKARWKKAKAAGKTRL